MPRGGGGGTRSYAGVAPAARRLAILAAARQLFVDEGFDTTSMAAVAAQAGVSKATLYAYFLDKQHLFACVLEELIWQAPDPWGAMHALRGPLRARLARVAHALLDVVSDAALVDIRRMLAGSVQCALVCRDAYWQLCFERYHLAMQALLVREVSLGTLAPMDAAQASRQFFGLVATGPLLRSLSSALPPAGRDWGHDDVAASVDLFLRGYRAEPGGRQAGAARRAPG